MKATLGPELFAELNRNQHVGTQTPVTYGDGGLSDQELDSIEKGLGCSLPDDFRYLFKNIQDPGRTLFPWKNFDKLLYDEYMQRVWNGIEFDIEHNAEWLEDRWGPKPKSLEKALKIAWLDFPKWPRLLPIYGHRFLAAEPCEDGNPVFSIVQTDIIYYGASLADYLAYEFLRDSYDDVFDGSKIRHIGIWSDFVR